MLTRVVGVVFTLMDTEGSVYGLDHQARCLKAQLGEGERSRFFVGTQDFKHPNELHLIDYDEDESLITTHKIPHEFEIRSIAPHPAQSESVITVFKEPLKAPKATLWRLASPESDATGKLRNDTGTMEAVVHIDPSDQLAAVDDILWDPSSSKHNRVLARGKHALALFALDEAKTSATATAVIPVKGIDSTSRGVACASWNPHADMIATGVGAAVLGIDLRTPTRPAYEIPAAHTSVRCIDYNPIKPQTIATGGTDGFIRFWDTRSLVHPIKEVSDHTHWVWTVSFNRIYDQLFLSAGSDCRVNLQSIISISSAAALSDITSSSDNEEAYSTHETSSRDEFSGNSKPTDGLVCTSDHHEDSVYAAEWSAADPWIYASASYDGRVAVNLVPRDHKYKIIL
ncbi:Protein tssc1 [Geranomyces variabilis]|nr:Protein tssc1 [Geranomyces variabilis]